MQIFFGYENRLLQQSGWLVSDDLGGEDAGCGGPGLVWLHMVCGCEAVGYTANFSETPLETAYGREINIEFTGNSSGGHSCSQRVCAIAHSCALIMRSNQHLDMPHVGSG